MRRRSKGLSTSGVLVSTNNGPKRLVTEQSTLEDVIIAENERKFHQTEGQCPLLEGKLLEDIGLCATGAEVSHIMQGTYIPPPDTTHATKSFLRACKQNITTNKNDVYEHLSFDHYCKAWSHAKEKTGSGLVHFGHWKAGIQDEKIAKVQWRLTIIPPRHGFSPNVWQKATDVMILKKEGVLDLERLRTIVLYEADFNFLNKCIGRQVMDSAVRNGNMAAEQCAKPKSSAQEQCITRRLIFDLVRYTRQALAMASSDLKSCYDRIVHSAASLAMQKNGLSPQGANTMFQTIQQCRHCIRTAYGDSAKSYGGRGKYKLPPMGAGQGNGAGPQMWSILSSVLFLAMHMEGLSTKFCQKMKKSFLSIVGFMYVDDMDLIRLRDEKDKHLLAEDLQLTLAYWNKLVQVTGGAIEPTKSGWYCYHQQWNHITGTYQYSDLGTDSSITARDKDGAKVPLSYLSCHSAQEMIGVKMTPTGNQDEQFQTMLDKSKEEARYIMEGNLSEVETRHAVVTSIFPRLAWPLPCMSITERDSNRLMRPVLMAALPKMGVVSTLGYDYIYGSSDFQGLGIPELYHSGFSTQIEILVEHIWKSSQLGHFLQMVIQEYILETGSSQHPLLPSPRTRIDKWVLTDNTWFVALRSYLIKSNIRVRLPIPLLTPLRDNDTTIMDALDGSLQLSALELKDVNTCRIYKKVTFLSDIATGDGLRLTADAWTDIPNKRRTEYKYNCQHYPNERQWKAWQSALSILNQSLTNRLQQPLGKWLLSPNDYFNYWDYFYDKDQHVLLHQSQNGQWTKYSATRKRTRQMSFSSQGTPVLAPCLTNALCRTTVSHWSNDAVIIEGYSINKMSTNDNDDSPHLTLSPIQHIVSIVRHFSDSKWALMFLDTSTSIAQLLEDFKSGQAIMVGDGSFNDNTGLGAGACIVSSADGKEYIIAGGPTPGPRSTQNPFRSEVGTMVGMGILSHALITITNSHPRIVVACDNDQALERPFIPKKYLSAKYQSASGFNFTCSRPMELCHMYTSPY
jgi:hypothetical protein